MKKLIILLLLIMPISVFADSARSSIVIDYDSGRILYEKNPNKKMLVASTTKIMTCIIALENAKLSKEIKVGNEVAKIYGTNIYVEIGEKITVEDLLYGLMLRSGNDAAVVLANNIFNSEEEFVKKMNEKAKEIGMKNTFFENPHGLDDNTKNYSTAYDMALLAKYAFKNKVYRKIVSTKKYNTKSNLKSYEWYNRMSLINDYKYCVGGKNGYTPKAGKTLVSYASKNNMNLIAVTLDDSDCYANHKKLYENIFKLYNNYKIIDKDEFIIDSSLIKNNVYIKKSFSYPLKKNEVDKISTSIHINDSKNGKVGEITIKLDSKKIGCIDIFSKEKEKEKMSFLQRLLKLFIR